VIERSLRAAAAAAALLLAAGAARADLTIDASFGFDGSAVNGTITPIRVGLASSEKTPLQCHVTVTPASQFAGVGSRGVAYSVDVYLAPGAKKRVTIPVLAQGYGYVEWQIEVRTDRRTLLRHGLEYEDGKVVRYPLVSPSTGGSRGSIDPCSAVVGVLGDPTLRCEWLGDYNRYVAGPGQRANPFPVASKLNWGSWRLSPPGGPNAAIPDIVGVSNASAPDSWLCYEGMDALLWVDPDPDSLPDASQATAVLEYAANGGRLLVALTPGSRLAAASALARALPAFASGHDDVPAADVAKALAGGTMAAGPPIPLARLGKPRGKVLAALPDGRPLVVTRSYGLGTIGVLSFDPRLLSGMTAAQHAGLVRLLFGPACHAEPPGMEVPPYSSSLDPIVNHMRQRFVSAPSFPALVVGLLLYVLAIGPLDYFILKKKNKLRRTVVTFPLIVGGFTVTAWAASFLLFGASSGQVRVAWLDVATSPERDADVLRGTDLFGTYTPIGTTLHVAYDQPRSFLGSLWLAGGSYDTGMEAGGFLDGVVALAPDGRPEGAFDLPLRAHRSVQARFSGELPTSLDASIRRAGGKRQLEIRNGFKVRVRDLVVIDGERMAFPGDLEPDGKTVLDLDGAGWTRVASEARLVDPRAGEGLFTGTTNAWQRGGTQFVPAEKSDEEDAAVRTRLARAIQGASVGAMLAESAAGTSGKTRMLARHGLDLSLAVRDGRVLVMGWCDSDPLGTLPAAKTVLSTAVVVRRLLPAEEDGR
jgi:hypothetical protein